MTIDWKHEIPNPLPDDILAEIRRDARAGNYRPEQLIIQYLGDRPAEFDPEKNHDDRDLTHKATATARRDDLQQDVDDAKRVISTNLPRKLSGCLTLVLLLLELVIFRGIAMHLGWGALEANALALSVTVATAIAVAAVRSSTRRSRS